MPTRNLGAKERAKDPRDILLATAQAPVPIPATWTQDMTWFARNYQGDTPFCGEHGGTHFLAILEHWIDATQDQRFSPRYGAIKMKTPSSSVYDGFPVEDGTTLTAIFKWLQKVGATSYEPLEDNVSLPVDAATGDYLDPAVVTESMDLDATNHKIAAYAFDALTLPALQQAIYQSKAVCVLIKCDDGFWGTSNPTFTQPLYGHFVVAYAYDETGIFIIDSADPNPDFIFKRIDQKYITPEFVFESGTAIDALPTEQAIVSDVSQAVTDIATDPTAPVSVKLNLLDEIKQFLTTLFSPKVGTASEPMNKIPAFNYSALEQSLLDIAIKIGVFAGLLVLNVISSALSNGSIELPYAAFTLPVLTLILSQLDSTFVAWSQKENVPVPNAPTTTV